MGTTASHLAFCYQPFSKMHTIILVIRIKNWNCKFCISFMKSIEVSLSCHNSSKLILICAIHNRIPISDSLKAQSQIHFGFYYYYYYYYYYCNRAISLLFNSMSYCEFVEFKIKICSEMNKRIEKKEWNIAMFNVYDTNVLLQPTELFIWKV